MAASFKLLAIGLAAVVQAVPQAPGAANSSAPASPATSAAPSSTDDYSTVAFNSSAATSYLPNNDFSNERLAFLWNQVGPIETAAVTTVVEPTPEPSPFPQPNWVHPLVPSYNRDPQVESAVLPDDFIWGVASAAFQIEGAANADGKGPSVWDLIPHRWANSIADNSTGDIGPNSYYYYKVDNARLQALGIPYYSFSIGWSRVFPFGAGPVNQAGVEYYDNVIQDMLDRNVIPVITLFHWDTPLELFNSYGAWTSENIVADFVRYAKYIITRYDQYVHAWVTFNEPQYCNWRFSNYPYGTILPSYNGIGEGGVKARFLCGHNTLLAHAEVYNWYKNEYKGTKPMTLKHSANYIIGNSTSEEDQAAVQRQYDYNMGWFGQCWTESGDYPDTLKQTLEPFDLLPQFTQEQKDKLKGSCDYFAVDAYNSLYASAPPNGISNCTSNMTDPNFPDCAPTTHLQPNGFPMGPNADWQATWLYSTPVGIRKFLSFITKEYFPASAAKGIQITEFGFADPYEQNFDTLEQILWDLRRADYVQSFLDNILAARVLDGVNVTGIYGWSIVDNFEWNSGLGTAKFGLQYLNTTSYERVPKASMFQFLNWFKQHGISGITPIDNATIPEGYGVNE